MAIAVAGGSYDKSSEVEIAILPSSAVIVLPSPASAPSPQGGNFVDDIIPIPTASEVDAPVQSRESAQQVLGQIERS